MIKLVRAHGWARNLDDKTKNRYYKKFKTSEFYKPYTFYDLAYNVRPSEINGFLASNQLKYLKKFQKIERKIFLKFTKLTLKIMNFSTMK